MRLLWINVIVILGLGFGTNVQAENIDKCAKITLGKPSTNYGLTTVGVRAKNWCSKHLYLTFTACSGDRVFGYGVTKTKSSKSIDILLPTKSAYKFLQAGGFTFEKGSDYTFVYEVSTKKRYKPISCKHKGKKRTDKKSQSKSRGDRCIKVNLDSKRAVATVKNVCSDHWKIAIYTSIPPYNRGKRFDMYPGKKVRIKFNPSTRKLVKVYTLNCMRSEFNNGVCKLGNYSSLESAARANKFKF